MIVGFHMGRMGARRDGPQHGGGRAEEAVVKHLAPICVVQFQQDPAKDQKLKALRDLSAYERGDYVKKQGWAKMPGEGEADGKVADECAKLITS